MELLEVRRYRQNQFHVTRHRVPRKEVEQRFRAQKLAFNGMTVRGERDVVACAHALIMHPLVDEEALLDFTFVVRELGLDVLERRHEFPLFPDLCVHHLLVAIPHLPRKVGLADDFDYESLKVCLLGIVLSQRNQRRGHQLFTCILRDAVVQV